MRLPTLPVVVLMYAIAPAFALAADPKANDPAAAVRATLHKYDKLVGPHEAHKALPFYHVTNTRERATAETLARVDGALAYLRQVAGAKYGKDMAEAMLKSVYATTPDDIDGAKIDVAGDVATIRFPDSDSPSTMVRVNGEWRLSVKAMLKSVGGRPSAFRKSIDRITKAANDVANRIQQNQYRDPESAAKDLLDRAFPKD